MGGGWPINIAVELVWAPGRDCTIRAHFLVTSAFHLFHWHVLVVLPCRLYVVLCEYSKFRIKSNN